MKSKNLVFVVDDDQTVRYSLERYFSRLGCEVKSLNNGFEVLLLCMYMVPDLILSDVRMPKLNGLCLLSALRKNETTKAIPIIFMSAYPNDKIMEQAKNLGAKHFLIKPFPLEYLDDILYRCFPHLLRPDQEATPPKTAAAG